MRLLGMDWHVVFWETANDFSFCTIYIPLPHSPVSSSSLKGAPSHEEKPIFRTGSSSVPPSMSVWVDPISLHSHLFVVDSYFILASVLFWSEDFAHLRRDPRRGQSRFSRAVFLNHAVCFWWIYSVIDDIVISVFRRTSCHLFVRFIQIWPVGFLREFSLLTF